MADGYAEGIITAFEAGRARKRDKENEVKTKRFGELAGSLGGIQDAQMRQPVLQQMSQIDPARALEFGKYYQGQDAQAAEQSAAAEKQKLRLSLNKMMVIRTAPPGKKLELYKRIAPEDFAAMQAQGISPSDQDIDLTIDQTLPEVYAMLGEDMPRGGFDAGAAGVHSAIVGKNGNVWVVNKDGTTKDTGVAVQKFAPKLIENETGVFNYDPNTQQMAPTAITGAAQNQALADRKAATTVAEAGAKAQIDLPRVEQNATQATDVLRQLEASPGLQYITGAYSLAPVIPGTPQAAADALAQQVQGKTFLEAYQSLRGGGQITEIEGAKAEAAIARLSRKQSTADYKKALRELREVIEIGVQRARKSAGQAPAAVPGGWTVRRKAQ